MEMYERLANDCLDHLIDLFGVSYAINFLLDSGYPKDFLVTLGFDEKDIEKEKRKEM